MWTPYDLVIASLIWAVFLMLIAIWWAELTKINWGEEMGSVRWDASKSWTSTFTAVGAILSVALSALKDILPPATHQMSSKGAYSGSSLFFGALIVLAAFFYNATLHPANVTALSGATKKELRGRVVFFLLATTLTIWGASGQVGTLGLLLEELKEKGPPVPLPAGLFQFLLIVVLAILVVYVPRSVDVAITNRTPNLALYTAQVEAQMRSLKQGMPKPVIPPQPEWTLL